VPEFPSRSIPPFSLGAPPLGASRRDFLASAGAAAAAVPVALTASAWADPQALPPLTAGVLGAVHSHAMPKIRLLMELPEYELVGVCESDASVQEEVRQLGVPLLSEEELLERCEVVVIESAVRDHARQGLLALQAGKHVHLEKPPATTIREMDALVEAARQGDLVLQTGYMWRYHPGFDAILEAVREGWLGDIYQVRGNMGNFVRDEDRAEWAEFPGGSMFELGSHLIDAIVRLLGPPRRINFFLQERSEDDSFRDNNLAVLEYRRAWAVVTNTSVQRTRMPQRCFEVRGTKGTALLEPIEPPLLKLELLEAAGPYAAGLQEVELPPYRRYEGDLQQLARAVRGERPLAISLDQERMIHQVILKASGMP
jgi:predicted dehydrogenase